MNPASWASASRSHPESGSGGEPALENRNTVGLPQNGNRAITPSCGFPAGFQQEPAEAVSIPVFSITRRPPQGLKQYDIAVHP